MVTVYVYVMREDDPRKCTSMKLLRKGLAKPLYKPRMIPKKAIVLNPYALSVLTVEDSERLESNGVVAVDCSWEAAAQVFAKRWKGIQRRLPFLLPGNPVSYCKPRRLSSLEALAATLYLLSYREDASRMLSLYKWGNTFLTLNRNLMAEYARCRSEEEVKAVEKNFFGIVLNSNK